MLGPPSQAEPGAHSDRRERLQVDHHSRNGVHTLALSGDLDIDSGPTIEAALRQCQTLGTTAVVVDLRSVTFIDSSGLWTITLARGWCLKFGYRFSLIRGREAVQAVFELTGLDDVLPFVDHA
jgi:anti-anti-sigma factor